MVRRHATDIDNMTAPDNQFVIFTLTILSRKAVTHPL